MKLLIEASKLIQCINKETGEASTRTITHTKVCHGIISAEKFQKEMMRRGYLVVTHGCFD